jgi:uncharacterized protein (DUF39 family)
MDTEKTWTIQDIKNAFAEYSALINQSRRTLNTKVTYLTHVGRFIRWLEGEVEV